MSTLLNEPAHRGTKMVQQSWSSYVEDISSCNTHCPDGNHLCANQRATGPKGYCRSHANASAVVYADLLHRWSATGTVIWRFQPKRIVDRPHQDTGRKHVAAHSHPQDELLTVIEGTWYVSAGNKYDPAKLQGYPAGSFVLIPAGLPHFVSTKESAVIVQLSGSERFRTDYIEK